MKKVFYSDLSFKSPEVNPIICFIKQMWFFHFLFKTTINRNNYQLQMFCIKYKNITLLDIFKIIKRYPFLLFFFASKCRKELAKFQKTKPFHFPNIWIAFTFFLDDNYHSLWAQF